MSPRWGKTGQLFNCAVFCELYRTGMWSTSPAPGARSRSWVTGTTRGPGWPTAPRTTIRYCALQYRTVYISLQMFGQLCYHCDGVIQGDVFTALGKAWCSDHFACSACNVVLGPKSKFFEVRCLSPCLSQQHPSGRLCRIFTIPCFRCRLT